MRTPQKQDVGLDDGMIAELELARHIDVSTSLSLRIDGNTQPHLSPVKTEEYDVPSSGTMNLDVNRHSSPSLGANEITFTDWFHNGIMMIWDFAQRQYHSHVTKTGPSRLRRRLSELNRTSITSYFTEAEKSEIAKAADSGGVTMSAFVAAAALKEARRTKSPIKPRVKSRD